MDSSAVHLIQQTAIDADDKRLPESLKGKAVALPQNYTLLDLERFRACRFRYRGLFGTASLADFVSYVKSHPGGQGFITANKDELEAQVFFNLGDIANPGHADWKAALALEKTPAFAALNRACGRAFSQREMIDFIEDWSHLFRGWREGGEDGEAGAEIRMPTVISALRKIKLAEKSETETVQTQFKASQSRLDSVEASSDDGLPSILTFTTEPYLGLQSRVISLRLSILTGGREPALKLRIVSEDQLFADIAQEFKARLIEEIGDAAPMLIGEFTP